MTNRIKSFRFEIIVIILLSLFFAILTEGVIVGTAYVVLDLAGKSLSPIGIEDKGKQPPDFSDSLSYGDQGGQNRQQMGGMRSFSAFYIAISLIAIVVGIILFSFYFLLMTKRFSVCLKEIASGIQEISIGNFENKIPIRYSNEFSMIAENLNEMSNNIYLLLCDERQNEDVKNELITSVAHDLRTPLTSIIGYLYLVLYRDDLEEEKRQHYIQIAYDKSKRLEQLIEDLFRYTKYSSDEVKLHYEKIDFVRFMDQLVEEFYPSFKDAELNYEFSCDLKEANIMADGNMLARAIGNLISNAIKYGKDGKIIKIALEQEEKYVVISVLNYGAIIPKEDLAHIFERFYRVENSRSEETGGSGLGLAIAKQIITLHEGTIEVRSDYEGTVFEVKLKLYEDEKEDSHEAAE